MSAITFDAEEAIVTLLTESEKELLRMMVVGVLSDRNRERNLILEDKTV